VVETELKILVGGMVAGDPGQGGATWAVLQYVLGLRRLGHDVLLVEPVPAGVGREVLRYFADVVAEFGLDGRAALLGAGTHDAVGVPYPEVLRFARDADLLVNISGMLTDDAVLDAVACRVYLDLDPGFTQLWHDVEGIDMGFDRHTHFATVGLAIGGESPVPTCGRSWLPTLPPVVLDRWPVADPLVDDDLVHDALTTIGNWRGYGSIDHDGVHYGQKAHSWRGLVDLPGRTGERFLLGFRIHPDERRDIDALAANGWELIDPATVAGTPAAYREFVGGSKAELGLAKQGYTASRSGWFSDRSACYLASGRPVIAADTGFGPALPVGEGLLTFADEDDAVAAVDGLRTAYERHAKAARAIAEEYLDSDRVLASLLDRLASC